MSLRVYLVEDAPIVFERLQAYIHDEGATGVGHAEDAATAVAEIAALCPDAVVVDIALREGTGFHVLDAIGDLPETERPARIVLTNVTRDWYRSAAKRLGAEHFFDKSSEIPKMLDVLRAMSPPGKRRRRPLRVGRAPRRPVRTSMPMSASRKIGRRCRPTGLGLYR